MSPLSHHHTSPFNPTVSLVMTALSAALVGFGGHLLGAMSPMSLVLCQQVSSALGTNANLVTSAADHQASSIGSLWDTVHWYAVGVFEKHGDPRVAHFPLMHTPWPVVFATILYYWFVRSVGPRMMQDKKPYELLPMIRAYNLGMAAWNAFGFYTGCHLLNFGLGTLGCRPVDPYQRDELTLTQIYYGWMFLTSRLVEFADTIFFVLRKKYSQVTSFHVFHHSSVPTLCWIFLKFAPGGNAGIFPFINTAIHTIMYSYYFLATFPAMRPFLWWKKYLTQMQIVQFLIIIAVCVQPLVIPGCKVPKFLSITIIGMSFVFIYLFVDFYLKSYTKNKRAVASAAETSTKKVR